MIVTIQPKRLHGSIEAIASKSYAHRIIIASALADKPTHITLNGMSNDILATLGAVEALGAGVTIGDGTIDINPIVKRKTIPEIFTNESGTTARVLLPVACALYEHAIMNGSGSLLNRPFATLCNTLAHHGINFSSDKLPIEFKGKLTGGEFKIPGNESSQYISGLMFALPLLKEKSNIKITGNIASTGYLDMTLDVLHKYGITDGYNCNGSEGFTSPGKIQVEGDMSNAAFWLSMGMEVTGLNPHSLQKDKAFATVKDMDEIDAQDIPDLVPILSVYACSKRGITKIYNASRLKIKESNRLETTKAMITALGGKIEITDDSLTIYGNGCLRGGTVDAFNDHRIAMSSAAASTICEGPITIIGAEAVNKSYPGFFDDFKKAGGILDVK